jgi:hypothetical protein
VIPSSLWIEGIQWYSIDPIGRAGTFRPVISTISSYGKRSKSARGIFSAKQGCSAMTAVKVGSSLYWRESLRSSHRNAFHSQDGRRDNRRSMERASPHLPYAVRANKHALTLRVIRRDDRPRFLSSMLCCRVDPSVVCCVVCVSPTIAVVRGTWSPRVLGSCKTGSGAQESEDSWDVLNLQTYPIRNCG